MKNYETFGKNALTKIGWGSLIFTFLCPIIFTILIKLNYLPPIESVAPIIVLVCLIAISMYLLQKGSQKSDDEFINYLKGTDLVTLKKVTESAEFTEKTKLKVIEFLNSNNPGWSLNS